MARGWESKAVEAQIESAGQARRARDGRSPEELERARARESLEMSRRGILKSIESSRSPRHVEQLRAALAAIDEKLARLG